MTMKPLVSSSHSCLPSRDTSELQIRGDRTGAYTAGTKDLLLVSTKEFLFNGGKSCKCSVSNTSYLSGYIYELMPRSWNSVGTICDGHRVIVEAEFSI